LVFDRKWECIEKILKIDIKPGWKKGKINFRGKGNQQPGAAPSDLIDVVNERPHALSTKGVMFYMMCLV